MEITKEHRNAINETNNANVLQEIFIKNGMTTLADQCKDLVLEGITTIDELASIALLRQV